MFRRAITTLFVLGAFPLAAMAQVKVNLIAAGSLPGTASDKSGLEDKLSEGTPANRLGGLSAIEYSGKGDRYFALPDRGPADGATDFPCRFHELNLKINLDAKTISSEVVATTLLKYSDGKRLLGAAALLEKPETTKLALDPEGIRLQANGDFVISDEYGPRICRFSPKGIFQSEWQLPEWMHLAQGANAEEWLMGTVPNRGLEGVALTPDGESVVAVMQGPLAQDAKANGSKRVGMFTRVTAVKSNENSGTIRQFVYPLENMSTGISEILAIDDERFLVLERDSESGASAKIKKIFKIDISKASDVSQISKLPVDQLPENIRPVSKTEFIDLMNPEYGLAGERTPEKPEGMTWGPKLADGRDTLVVCFDNDLEAERENLFVVFGISGVEVKGAK